MRTDGRKSIGEQEGRNNNRSHRREAYSKRTENKKNTSRKC